MIYSVHDPYTGQFKYFEAKPDVAINDDLPTPRWGADVRTKIGIPASMAARPLPPGAKAVGAGALPIGLMSNGLMGSWQGTQKGVLPSGLGAFDGTASSALPAALLVGAGASAMYGWTKQESGWPFLGLGALFLIGAIVTGSRS